MQKRILLYTSSKFLINCLYYHQQINPNLWARLGLGHLRFSLWTSPHATRQHLRCILTGRGRGRYQFLGTSRVKIKALVTGRHIVGFRKSGW